MERFGSCLNFKNCAACICRATFWTSQAPKIELSTGIVGNTILALLIIFVKSSVADVCRNPEYPSDLF